jgi:hypothetical protein
MHCHRVVPATPAGPLVLATSLASLFASNRDQDVTLAAVDAAYKMQAIQLQGPQFPRFERAILPLGVGLGTLCGYWKPATTHAQEERQCQDPRPELFACSSMYASWITHPRTYRFVMAVFDEFELQCSGAAFACAGNRLL